MGSATSRPAGQRVGTSQQAETAIGGGTDAPAAAAAAAAAAADPGYASDSMRRASTSSARSLLGVTDDGPGCPADPKIDHILGLATTLVKAPVAASLDGGPAAAAGAGGEGVAAWLTSAAASPALAALLAGAAAASLVTIPDVRDERDPAAAALTDPTTAAGPPPAGLTALAAVPVVCGATGRAVGALLVAPCASTPPLSPPALAAIGAMLAREGAAAGAAAGARAVGAGLLAAADGGGAPYLVVNAPGPASSAPSSASEWTIVHASGAAAGLVGVTLARLVGAPLGAVFARGGGGGDAPPAPLSLPPAVAAAAAASQPFTLRGLTPVLGPTPVLASSSPEADVRQQRRLLVTLAFRPATGVEGEGSSSSGASGAPPSPPPLPPPPTATPGRLFFAAMHATHGDVAGVLEAPPPPPGEGEDWGGGGAASPTAAAAPRAAEAAAADLAGGRATPCAPPSTRPPFPQLTLGPLLGAGTYGRVYRGGWKEEGAGPVRPVAVKVVDSRRAARGPDGRTPLEAAVAAAAAGAANTVACLAHADVPGPGGGGTGGATTPGAAAAREGGGETWLVLEMCGLGSLGEAIDGGLFGGGEAGPASRHATIARTGADVAAGLAALHAAGFAHGDLAAGNVLLATATAGGEEGGGGGAAAAAAAGAAGTDPRGWVAKVTDFGLAVAVATAAAPTPAPGGEGGTPALRSAPYGTVPYLPPERLAPPPPGCGGPPPPSPPGDVYALGALLWGMLAGRRPWAGTHRAQVMHAVGLAGGGLGPPPGGPHPPSLVALVAACLDRDPAARPTAAGVEAALRAALARGEAVDGG